MTVTCIPGWKPLLIDERVGAVVVQLLDTGDGRLVGEIRQPGNVLGTWWHREWSRACNVEHVQRTIMVIARQLDWMVRCEREEAVREAGQKDGPK